MKLRWDAAALVSPWRALPAAVANDASNRDEYGLLTFDAQCAALRERAWDPRWPLRDPSAKSNDGLDGLGFASATQLCDAMASLPRTLRVYTHPLGDEEKRRYAAARVAPTFNRGYDVEEHVLTHLGPAGLVRRIRIPPRPTRSSFRRRRTSSASRRSQTAAASRRRPTWRSSWRV